MRYKYMGFIPQNIAPNGVKSIGVYNSNNEKVCNIDLGRLKPVVKTKLYSIGIITDTHFAHTTSVAWKPTVKLDNALTYFENMGCAFVANCGDNVQTGFYRESAPDTYDATQFAEYDRVRKLHDIDVYTIGGNHESYVKAITNNLTEYKQYTGADMYYSKAYGNDLYIFLTQPTGSIPMTDEALQWLYETLEANRNKRVFIFVHPYISDDSGNPLKVYGNPIFDWWGVKTTAFKNLLKHYKNTVLFHGHTHMMFECQELDDTANYTEINGFRSVHIPSLSRPANIVDGARAYVDTNSYGYLMDVYDDCIVLNGRDFIKNEYVPLGVYKIDTTLVEVPANTFVDSTGTIH